MTCVCEIHTPPYPPAGGEGHRGAGKPVHRADTEAKGTTERKKRGDPYGNSRASTHTCFQ